MQINSVNSSRIVQKQQNFKASSEKSDFPELNETNSSKLKNNTASTKISRNKFENKPKENEKLSLLKKLYLYPSLRDFPTILPISYGIYRSIKIHSLKKKVKISTLQENKLNEFKKSSSKKLLILCASAIPVYFLTDYINKKLEGKNIAKAQKQVDNFNEHNGTSVKLVVKPTTKNNMQVAGAFKPLSGQIELAECIPRDIMRAESQQTYIVNHELTHAKQRILMASSENGIAKLNYLHVKKKANELNDEDAKKFIYDSYQVIKNEKSKDEAMITHDGRQLDAFDVVTALYKVIYEKETNPDNIPIIINKEFYEKAKAARGPLTPEEEKKAQAYFEADEKYTPKINGVYVLSKQNPGYTENLLEKEASKASYTKSVT